MTDSAKVEPFWDSIILKVEALKKKVTSKSSTITKTWPSMRGSIKELIILIRFRMKTMMMTLEKAKVNQIKVVQFREVNALKSKDSRLI